MAELKNYSSSTDFNVHLSFHLVGDGTFATQKKLIENLLHEYFGMTYSLEHEDPSAGSERELVYRLEKPIISEPAANREYFEKLKSLFDNTKRYLPSFTQSLEATS